MPIINPSILRTPDQHLAAQNSYFDEMEMRRSGMSFGAFLAYFGIRDPGELSIDQLQMFIAARNMLPTIESVRIPHGKTPEKDAYGTQERDSEAAMPAALMKYGEPENGSPEVIVPLLKLDDIPFAVSEDLGILFENESAFVHCLANGELRMRKKPSDNESDADAPPPNPDPISTDPNETAAATHYGTYGYVLLDGSETMGTTKDKRGIVGRGAALAFLYTLRMNENPGIVHIFHESLTPGIGGHEESEFHKAIAAIVLHETESHMTALQTCLGKLAKRLEDVPGRVDILLITDGRALLREKPFSSAHLHTVLLASHNTNVDILGSPAYVGSWGKLEDWSDTFLSLYPDHLKEACVPRREDLLSLRIYLDGVEEELASTLIPERSIRIGQRVHNIRALYSLYAEENPGSEDEDLEILRGMIESAERALKGAHQRGPDSNINSEISPILAEDIRGLQKRNLRSILDNASGATPGAAHGSHLEPLSILDALRLFWGRVRGFLERHYHQRLHKV